MHILHKDFIVHLCNMYKRHFVNRLFTFFVEKITSQENNR